MTMESKNESKLIINSEVMRFLTEHAVIVEMQGKNGYMIPFIIFGSPTGDLSSFQRLEFSVLPDHAFRTLTGVEKVNHRIQMIEKYSTSVVDKESGSEYFFFPYWIEKNAKGELIKHALGKLPSALVAALDQMRNTVVVPSIENDVRKYPETA